HHRKERPDIGRGIEPDPEESSVVVEPKLGIAENVARLIVGDMSLAALTHPSDRTADALRGPGNHRDLGVEPALHAERAADIPGDHRHPAFRDAVYMLAQHGAPGEGPLLAGIDGEMVAP